MPDDPEKLKEYIDQLHDRIEFFEQELTESQKDVIETKEEKNKVEELNDRWFNHARSNLGDLRQLKEDLREAAKPQEEK